MYAGRNPGTSFMFLTLRSKNADIRNKAQGVPIINERYYLSFM